MSTHEYRAWRTLWSMGPAYIAYFTIQVGFSSLIPTMLDRIVCLAVAAGVHAAIDLAGVAIHALRHRNDERMLDERDRAIDARATRSAYFLLMTGLVLVGVVMPFGHRGWSLVHAALLFLVLGESMRAAWTVVGYRSVRFAH